MDMEIKDKFISLWGRYFNNAELPIAFYYSFRADRVEVVKHGTVPRCLIGALAGVRNGRSLGFNINSIGCPGGKRYLGFTTSFMPDFEYFLSCGIPGKLEGERYKKTTGLAGEIMKKWSRFNAPAPFAIFKRWDNLDINDNPEVVIFFVKPDVLAGLFTLANFDASDPEGVITPMGSGCSSIISFPYLQKDLPSPKAVIGMFDPSARPYVAKDILSFSAPMKKFVTMIDNMEESFLITDTWRKLQKRIE